MKHSNRYDKTYYHTYKSNNTGMYEFYYFFISSFNTEIRYNLNDEFDFETLEKWLESQKVVINQVMLYGKKKKVEKKIKNLEKDFK